MGLLLIIPVGGCADRLPVQALYHGFQIAGPQLAARQQAFNGRQFENNAEQNGQGAVTVQDLVVEDNMLQGVAFDGHQNHPMGGIQRRHHAPGPGDQADGSRRAGLGAEAAAQAKIGVETGHGLFR